MHQKLQVQCQDPFGFDSIQRLLLPSPKQEAEEAEEGQELDPSISFFTLVNGWCLFECSKYLFIPTSRDEM